ncbi:hypothetical protein F4680DRAFT_404593 [Xylaria scruposa]|nr:hypothetical protein F4680DRAFT_404593 [Xylaria scruposa]
MSDHNTGLGHEEAAWESDIRPAQPAIQKKYKCPQCPSSFKRPENLKRHQRGHGENRKFICQICDKSFARSDILGRHVATHIERRDDNSHRRRACRECARVRERCSRGEPCRRCTTKGLCCVYPEESQFKIIMPGTWSPTVSEPDDQDATGAGSSGPDSTPESPRDALFLNHGPSQWQVEGSLSPLPEQYILSPSVFPHTRPYPGPTSHQEVHFASFLRNNALSPQDEVLYPRSASGISTNDWQFVESDAELDGVSGAYYQTTDMPSSLTSSLSRVGIYQPSPPNEFQGNYADGQPLDHGHFNTTFDACIPSFGTPSSILGQPGIPDFSGNTASQEDLTGVQVPNMGFDNREAYYQSLQTPWSSIIDLKAYSSITTTFADSSGENSLVIPFDALITIPGTNQHDSFPRICYDNKEEHHENRNDGTTESPGGFGTCFDNLYIE